jgi:hypothetical protein
LAYVRDVAVPYAAEHGIALHWLRKVLRDGTPDTLLARIERSNDLIIPVRLERGPMNRKCTGDFKISVAARWLREHGASRRDPAIVGLGISRDEFQRMRTDSGYPYETLTYPLIDLRLDRQDCQNIISRAGLPVPEKSSCFFCPFHRLTDWQRIKRETPDLFDRSVALERTLDTRAVERGYGRARLGRHSGYLDQTVTDDQQSVFDFDDACESGYCMT